VEKIGLDGGQSFRPLSIGSDAGVTPGPPVGVISMTIDLIDAKTSPRDSDWIKQVLPQYLTDLAVFDPDYFRLAARYRKAPDSLDSWLSQIHVHPLVIAADQQRAGFALIVQAPFPGVSRGVDYRMGEFFIQPKYRRRGIGRRAAWAIFNRFPGVWEVTELPKNEPAIAFWRSAIGEYTGGDFHDAPAGDVQRQSFRTAGA